MKLSIAELNGLESCRSLAIPEFEYNIVTMWTNDAMWRSFVEFDASDSEGQLAPMGLLNAFRNLISTEAGFEDMPIEKRRDALRRAWGLDEDDPVFQDLNERELLAIAEVPAGVSRLDQQLWQTRMLRLAAEAGEFSRVDFAGQVAELMADSGSLGIAPEVASETARAAFETAVRQVVADRQVSLAELAYLDSLRKALELSEATVKTIIRDVISEAESVFGSRIEGFVPFFTDDQEPEFADATAVTRS